MNQQENDPTVQGNFRFDATFEEEEHQSLVFLEQIAKRENYICIEVSKWISPIRKTKINK